MKEYAGFQWPDLMEVPEKDLYLRRTKSLDRAIALTPEDRRRWAVQAGGNLGIWPRKLSFNFQTVYTFEPDTIAFQYLTVNCPYDNVIRTQVALGDKLEMVSMIHTGNSSHRIVPVKTADTHPAVQVRLDDLYLLGCDLLALDVEGWESRVFVGAQGTIEKYHPVILFESDAEKGKQGAGTYTFIHEFLRKRSYEFVQTVQHDEIWVHKKGKGKS